MKRIVKNLFVLLMVLSVLCGSLSTPVKAAAKKASKVTKVVTLTPGKPGTDVTIYHLFSVDAKEEVRIKVKFLEVKGKVSLTAEDKENYPDWKKGLYWAGAQWTDGQSALFSPWGCKQYNATRLTKNSFKKGVVIKADAGKGFTAVGWYLPSGIKKIRMKVTYYTKSGRPGIRFKKTQKIVDRI